MVYIRMRRIFIFIICILFLIGCSNIEKREDFTLKERESLIVLIDNIKDELQVGNTELLRESFLPSIRNDFVKSEIENIDFSKINIFNSKPIFLKNKASNIVGFTLQSTTIYYDVEYSLKNGIWKIVKFKERRG